MKMQVYRALPILNSKPMLNGSALTIGTFDGVHRGHQELISRLNTEAKNRNLQTVALTFEDMPICLLRPDNCPTLLTLAEEKIAAFSQTSLDNLFIVPFTRDIASQEAREWIQFWVRSIDLRLLITGPDFALGRDRKGTVSQLHRLGGEMGFEVLSLEDKLAESDQPISSTLARQTVERGQMERVTALLGRSYQMAGTVVPGQQLGRTIGFPTINVRPHARKCLPRDGVYAVLYHCNNEVWPAALNIGMRPTVDGDRHQIEFHVVGQVIDQAPKEVVVEFISRLRDEFKFANLEALKAQLKDDVKNTIIELGK